VTATGNPAPTLSATGALPAGVTFSPAGVLSGTPAAGAGGAYLLAITASNGVGSSATQTFTLTVDQAPAITSGSSTTFTVGSSDSFTVTATGYPAPTLSAIGALPAGVTFSGGVLSGTPAAGTGGAYSLAITASNGVGSSATQTFTLTVDQAPAITSGSSATFTVGSSGSFTVTATGYPAPTLSAIGALPAGVTFSGGVLSGTPAAGTGGAYSLAITASNGVGSSATQTFTLTVDQAPAITSGSSATFTVGSSGSFTVTATGYPAPTLSATGALPAGVTFSGGVLSGTPAAGTGGAYSLAITASNGVGSSATQTFMLTVDQAPAITSGSSATFTVGSSGSFTVTATGYPAPTLSAIGALPAGVTFSGGVLSGTPAAGTGGAYSLAITASNGVGSSATQTFTLTVDQAPAITNANGANFTAGVPGSFMVSTSAYPMPPSARAELCLPESRLRTTATVRAACPAWQQRGRKMLIRSSLPP
jgi:large repetitive protein